MIGALGRWARAGLAWAQGFIGLVGAGAVLVEAHKLFLQYYGREWRGLQLAGVNDCAGVDRIANGDLFEGQTFCNHVINFVPWTEMYRRHWQVALAYYGAIFAALILVGFLIWLVQRRLGSRMPFGGAAAGTPAASEHLR
jgi:hypothetical protein